MNFQRMASELLWVFNVHYKEGNRVKATSHRYHYQLMYVKSGRCIYMSRNLKYILELVVVFACAWRGACYRLRDRSLNYLRVKFV